MTQEDVLLVEELFVVEIGLEVSFCGQSAASIVTEPLAPRLEVLRFLAIRLSSDQEGLGALEGKVTLKKV